MNQHLDNPYKAPPQFGENPALSPEMGRPAEPTGFGMVNVVGLILTVAGGLAFDLIRRRLFDVFTDFEMALPTISRFLHNDVFVYAVMLVLTGTFRVGIVIRPHKRSVRIGQMGIVGWLLAVMFATVGLVLPLISLFSSVGP